MTYAELQQQLGKGSLSAGYTSTHSSNSNNYLTNNVGRLANVTNDVQSSHVNYSHDIKSVNLSGGLAHTHYSPSSSRTYSNNVTRYSRFDYDGRCVSLSITYTFKTARTSFERDDSSDEYTRRTESR